MNSRLTSSGFFPGWPTGRRPEQALDGTGPAGREVSARLSGLVSRLGLGPEDIAALARQGFVAIDRRMGPEPSLDQLRILTPHLEMCLKLARQVDRYAQLELRHFRSPPPPPVNPIPAPGPGEESNP
jgi:hypothetical protein